MITRRKNRKTAGARIAAIVALAALSLLSLPRDSEADAEFILRFSETELAVVGNVNRVNIADFNGDGLPDIMAATRVEFFFFYQKDGNRYGPKPDRVRPPGNTIVAYDIGDVDGRPGDEILFLHPRAVYYWGFNHEKKDFDYNIIVREKTTVSRPAGTGLTRMDFLTDTDGDGVEEILVPLENDILFLERTPLNGREVPSEKLYTARQRITVRTSADLSRINIPDYFQGRINYVFSYPEMRFIDANSDGKKDLVLHEEPLSFTVYPQKTGRIFDTRRGSFKIEMKTRSKKTRSEYFWSFPEVLADIDGDGILDLLIIGSTRLIFFRGEGDGRSFDDPTQIIKGDGNFISVRLLDFDFDGKLDLYYVITPKFSAFTAMKIFLSGMVDTITKVYMFRGEEGRFFGKTSDWSRQYATPLSVSIQSTSLSITARGITSPWADFNNDGRRDIVASSDTDNLAFYLQTEKPPFFPEKSDFKNTVMDSKPYNGIDEYCRELNGDGYSDIIILYRNMKSTNDALRVYLSKTPE